jgi:hypothetical protein
VLQAAIAALHLHEPQDWPQIAALYGELARLTGSSVVELNRAAAIAEAGEVEAARSSSFTRTPSGASSSGGWRSSKADRRVSTSRGGARAAHVVGVCEFVAAGAKP